MLKTKTHVPTTSASAYLFKLCKHFAKKIPATWSDDHQSGTASFDWGTAVFVADDAGLTVECLAADSASLERLADVVAQHLALMTRKNPVVVAWHVEGALPDA